MSGTERPAKRARLEADKRRDVLAKVQDQYADIDFTRFQKAVDADETGEATPYRFVLVRPTETALVKDWRQWSSYEPDGTGETLSEEGLAHLCTTGRQRRHYTGPFGCTVQSNLPAPGELLCATIAKCVLQGVCNVVDVLGITWKARYQTCVVVDT